MGTIVLGIEKLVTTMQSAVQGRRIGLVAHPASTSSDYRHTLDLLIQGGARMQVLFGPEHGFGGQAQDMAAVSEEKQGPYGLPLLSLYGQDEASLAPTPEALAGLDALVVDLFDIGSRYYTFVWTAVLCLRACHQAGVEMILTDRPNPLGGDIVEGAPQDGDFLSFVGLSPVSNRHGLTPCELVSMVAEKEGLGAALTTVRMEGWRRSMLFPETGLPWIMPSPNMPTFDTAVVYPGMCLIEGTWASEGRGTTRPFELVGAPGIDSSRLAQRLREMKLEGLAVRPMSFEPGFQKHAQTDCRGVQLHVVDNARFLPYRTGVAVLLALKAECKDRFVWREQPYEFVTDRPAIDLLAGNETLRRAVDSGASIDDVARSWQEGEGEFGEYRQEFLMY
ncbi:MAG: DUF1343 domain-containing protein [Proteobacteria bacterium]|nr:DUF1343 domain-containing protein [Pseudomonadota bacterium]